MPELERQRLGVGEIELLPDAHIVGLPLTDTVALVHTVVVSEPLVDSVPLVLAETDGLAEPQPLADRVSDPVPLPQAERLPESVGDGDVDELSDTDTVPH